MNKEIAKAIRIKEYLATKNMYPQRQNNHSLWYISPFRKEQKASFKVNVLLNKWHDFGNDQKGDIIDLVMKLEQIDNFNIAIQFLKNNFNSTSFSFRGKEVLSNTKNNDIIKNLKVKKLQHLALLELLQKRKISKTLAENYCKEIHYDLNGKHYFAIGFKNNKGGFATLNSYFKGCIAPNDISSFINSQNTTALIFEGFTDFLSYLTLKNNKRLQQDYHILNSVHNIEKLLPKLKKYNTIYCFLDNDDSGKITFKRIENKYPKQIIDQSIHYKKNNDLNDYLTSKKHRL